MPIQSRDESTSPGRIVLDPVYQDGHTDLEGFSHIYLLYLFHRSHDYDLMVRPFLDDVHHGVFATRAPRRPNPIGLSIVRLKSIHDNIIEFSGADMLDGTPLLDIKPYVQAFDHIAQVKSGWVTTSLDRIKQMRSDSRFIEPDS